MLATEAMKCGPHGLRSLASSEDQLQKFHPITFVRPPVEVKLAGATGGIAGYASVFGGEPDAYGDVIARGAFARSLARHKADGTAPALLWSHDPAEPIGRWDLATEDEIGLRVEGILDGNVQRAREALSLIKGGSVTGLSIGFRTMPGGSRFDATGVRVLTEVDLVEVSLVALPANRRARVEAKSVGNLRDFERFLREAGFSKSQAARLAKGGWTGAGMEDSEESEIKAMAETLNSARLNILNIGK
jgi:uncharacterized protein